MNPLIWPWLQFFGLALVIGIAGYRLSFYADQISEATGLGRNWIGLILLATITSLPELLTGVSAVSLAGAPDLAVGDVLGSCVVNLTLVFILDLFYRESSVYSKATQGHLLSASLGAILLAYIGYGITVGGRFLSASLGHVGIFALAIPAFYLLAMRTLFLFERNTRQKAEPSKGGGIAPIPKLRLYGFFALSALVVVMAGSALPFVGTQIMRQMGWTEAFVGTLFIAAATSLPEIAVTISAVRLRAVELAFSNVLGSNLFNVVILAIDDLFYREGPLLQSTSPIHAATALSAVMMTGLVLTGLILRPNRRILNTVNVMSLLLIAVYVLNAYLLYFGIGPRS